MNNLEKILIYIINNFPRRLLKTELVKTLYVFEYYYYQLSHDSFTQTEFVRDEYGPNAPCVYNTAEALEGIIAVETYENIYGNISYEYYIKDAITAREIEDDVPEQAKFVADYVIDLLRGVKKYHGFIDVAYKTPPFKKILDDESKNDCLKMIGRGIDMSFTKGIYKPSKQEKSAAKKRLLVSQNRGSDEEYYAHIAEQCKKFEDTRRRANKCLLQ